MGSPGVQRVEAGAEKAQAAQAEAVRPGGQPARRGLRRPGTATPLQASCCPAHQEHTAASHRRPWGVAPCPWETEPWPLPTPGSPTLCPVGSPALHPATALQLGLGGAPAPSLLAWAQLSRLEALSDRDLWGWSQPGTLSVEAKQTHEKPWREECVCVCVSKKQ